MCNISKKGNFQVRTPPIESLCLRWWWWWRIRAQVLAQELWEWVDSLWTYQSERGGVCVCVGGCLCQCVCVCLLLIIHRYICQSIRNQNYINRRAWFFCGFIFLVSLCDIFFVIFPASWAQTYFTRSTYI